MPRFENLAIKRKKEVNTTDISSERQIRDRICKLDNFSQSVHDTAFQLDTMFFYCLANYEAPLAGS